MSSFADILALLADNWAMAPVILAVMFLFAGVVSVNKESLDRYGVRIRNARNARRFMLAAFMAGAYCLLWFFFATAENVGLFIVLGALVAAFFGTCLASLAPIQLSRFRNTWLRRRGTCLMDGTASSQVDFLAGGRPWYLFTRREQVEFSLFAAQCYSELGDVAGAYGTICEIDENWLYDDERTIVQLQKAMFLIQMGNMRSADMLLGQLAGPNCDPMVWFGLAYISENAGDMNAAFELIGKAKASLNLDRPSTCAVAQVISNYARYVRFRGQRYESLRWLGAAWKSVRESDDNRYVVLCAGNYLNVMAADLHDANRCDSLYAEMTSCMKRPSVLENRMKLNLVRMELFRTLGDWAGYLEAAEEYRGLLADLPDEHERNTRLVALFCDVALLRLKCDWLDGEMRSLLERGLNGNPRQRLRMHRMLSEVFNSPELRAAWKRGTYEELRARLKEYCLSRAEEDLNALRGEWSDVDVHANAESMRLEIWLEQQRCAFAPYGERSLCRAFLLQEELVRMLNGAGLAIDAGRAMLDFAKTCHSPACVIVEVGGAVARYSDFIESAGNAPEPLDLPDGARLAYRLPFPEEDVRLVDAPYSEAMGQTLDQLMLHTAPWGRHPMRAEFAIEAAQLYMALGPSEDGRVAECLRIVEDSVIDESSLNPSAQEALAEIRRELGLGVQGGADSGGADLGVGAACGMAENHV